jgi:crotonobetainyl-CoA:carnitine CoA-transferase CaiB-like acyl-CoA transferase
MQPATSGPLAGIRVLDVSTVLAGPLAAQVLGDYGADVIKIEHPLRGDAFRTHGTVVDGHGLWWKIVARNKRCIGLYLGHPDGADIFKRLVADADVLVENFRPGTLEKWGLGPDVLQAINPKLVIARVTGFGQVGPYAHRPGFGTLAEAMSGFAALTGEPDGPPTLPPMGLADTLAGLTTVAAVMMALYDRDVRQRPGQTVDVSLLRPMAMAVGPGPTVYARTGTLQPRTGNRSASNAPRNTYRSADGRWLAISTSATPIAERVMRLVGHPEVISEQWFATASGRVAHGDLLDAMVADWIAARTAAEVTAAFEAADAAVAPVYTAADLAADEHVVATGMLRSMVDDDLGELLMPEVLFDMSDTPGAVRFTGRGLGADTQDVLSELGLDAASVGALREQGVVA